MSMSQEYQAVEGAVERELGVPVESSMQAMVWCGLRFVGVTDLVAGFGRLLREA